MLILLIIVAAALFAGIGWVVSTSNRFKTLLVKIAEADSGVDVALTKRFDTLTKLMDVVRAFARHEADTLEAVVGLRRGAGVAEKAEASRQMDEMTARIHAVAEAYPALRSNENYRQLQDGIMDAEDHLQAARRVYNMNVSAFNQAIVMFPGSVITNNHHYQAMEFFEAEEPKRADVKINL
jgi:LemA protein